MTDNLEQLEKDWPPNHPKDIGSVKLFLAFAAFISALTIVDAFIVTAQAKSRHDHFWLFYSVVRFFSILSPWVWAAVPYRRVRAVVAKSGASSDLLPAIEFFGVQTLFFVTIAIEMVFLSLRR
jgi:hypothetical protein